VLSCLFLRGLCVFNQYYSNVEYTKTHMYTAKYSSAFLEKIQHNHSW